METNYSRWKPILLVCRFSDPYFYFFFCRSPFFCLRRPFNFFSFPHLYQRLSTSFATTPSYGVCKAIYTVWLSFLSFRRTRSPVIRHLSSFSRISNFLTRRRKSRNLIPLSIPLLLAITTPQSLAVLAFLLLAPTPQAISAWAFSFVGYDALNSLTSSPFASAGMLFTFVQNFIISFIHSTLGN